MKIKLTADFHLILLDDLLETTTDTTGKKKKKDRGIPKQDTYHLSKREFLFQPTIPTIPGQVLVSLEDVSPRWTERIICTCFTGSHRVQIALGLNEEHSQMLIQMNFLDIQLNI